MRQFYRREMMGMLDFGRSWPPLPRALVLSDRTTGTQYLLSHNSGSDEVVLTAPLPTRARGRPEEPLLSSPIGALRLFVDDGALRQELAPTQDTVEDGPLFTLNYGDRRTTYEITAEGVAALGDALRLRRWDDVGKTVTITDLGDILFLGLDEGGVVFESGVFEAGIFA